MKALDTHKEKAKLTKMLIAVETCGKENKIPMDTLYGPLHPFIEQGKIGKLPEADFKLNLNAPQRPC